MNKTDVRVGNYYLLEDDFGVMNIVKFTEDDVLAVFSEDKTHRGRVYPLELTDKWVDKAITINNNYKIVFVQDEYKNVLIYLKCLFNDDDGNTILTRLNIKYIHQIQDLYTSHTGRELKLPFELSVCS